MREAKTDHLPSWIEDYSEQNGSLIATDSSSSREALSPQLSDFMTWSICSGMPMIFEATGGNETISNDDCDPWKPNPGLFAAIDSPSA